MEACTLCRLFLALILILLNLLGLCLGVFLVVGSSILLSAMNGFGLFTTGIESPIILGIIAGVFLVLLAGVAIAGAYLACIGSNTVARWIATILLFVYICVMVVLILLELAATIALAISRREIIETAGEWYTQQIQEQVDTNPEYIKRIDTLQTELECCGFHGPDDYKNTTLGLIGKLPNSCCMQNETVTVTYNSTCYFNSTTLIITGCRMQLEKYVDENIVPLSVGGGILIVAEISCVVIPIILIIVMFLSAKRDGYEKA